jgi:catechol 2,3-dioxygenase-like lactoylglutathione lyase family enzyme
MFTSAKPFPSFSVNDLQKAKDFYHRTLGFEVSEMPEGLELRVPGATKIFMYPKPNHTPATFTVLNFPVADIDQAVDELARKGVRFERYDDPNIRTNEKGIARCQGGPSIAWFKDPAGNILSVLEEK